MEVNELKDFIVLDTETTGFNPEEGADAIEVSVLKVGRDFDGRFRIYDEFDTYINPQYPLPPKTVKFNKENHTGVNDAFLQDKPTPFEAAKALFNYIGADPIIVGHNIKFDIGFINKLYLQQLNIPFNPSISVDTLELSRFHLPATKHNLDVMFEYTSKRHSGGVPTFHNSLADCRATLDVLEFIADNYYPPYMGEPSRCFLKLQPNPNVGQIMAAMMNPMTKNVQDIPFHLLNKNIKGIAVGLYNFGDFIPNSLKVNIDKEYDTYINYAYHKMKDMAIDYYIIAVRDEANDDIINISGLISRNGEPEMFRDTYIELPINGQDTVKLAQCERQMKNLFLAMDYEVKKEKASIRNDFGRG